MIDAFKLATRNITKTHGIKLDGIRTWECTYNQTDDEYHPHFNVVVDTYEGAELIRAYWMTFWEKRVGAKHVSPRGQFITPIATTKDLLEVFKYSTKLAVSHDEETKAQDWIYQCTKGKRLAQSFGNLRRIKIENEPSQIDEVPGETEHEIWSFELAVSHYVNAYGETLVSDDEKTDYLNAKYKEKIERAKRKENRRIPPDKLNELMNAPPS